MQPQCVWALGAELGEGPVWVTRESALYFVDIDAHRVHRYHPASGDKTTWEMPGPPGFIHPCESGGFLCGLHDGLYAFDERSGTVSRRHAVEEELHQNRINDGFVDSNGRLWFGTLNKLESEPTGSLYCYDSSRGVRRHDQGYTVTNGPVVEHEGKVLYHTDSLAGIIYAFNLDAMGNLSGKRIFLKFAVGVYPDGMAVDRHGNIWIALFGGWRVEKYSPRGQHLATLNLPCANVTKMAFGDDDLMTLFITTASTGLAESDAKHQPLAGALFSIRVDVPGSPATPIAL